MAYLPMLALLAGAAIATQATMNARLGVLLNDSLLAAGIAFFVSSFFVLMLFILRASQLPQMIHIKSVPLYLWFSGGVLSTLGVTLLYYLIPRMGAGSMMSFALSGQLLVAIVASHFGWFDSPIKPISTFTVMGAISLIAGVAMLNWEANYAG